MRLTPPKNSTFWIALLLAVIGLILGLLGFFMVNPLAMLFGGLGLSTIMIIAGLVLGFLGWLVLAVGVYVEGF
ncbi:MAG: DUF378 domain-containing protein [Candidatus Lokiarchaeia archaeon]